jgi:hypothetical protein
MNDPQASSALVLKPPKGFEAIYQGEPRTTPIALVAADAKGEFVATDDQAGEPGISATLQRYVAVPLGSSLLILIPQAIYIPVGDPAVTPSYTYELRWRLRTLTDWARGAQNANPSHPWQLLPRFGHQQPPGSTPAEVERIIMPAYSSESLTPSMAGTNNRSLVAQSIFGTASQGMYTAGGPTATDGDVAFGPVCFPPLLRAAIGNELGLCITRSGGGNWNFNDGTASGDGALSNLYGENVAGGAAGHPYFPGIGTYLISMARPTTP